MKRLFLILMCLLPAWASWAQRADVAVDSIVHYLSTHCLDGDFIDEHNGRNHASRGHITVDNGPMGATGQIVRDLQPYLDQLPHLRRMTDERAGEVLEGRIAMRLKPESGDTSAYFLMTYSRSNIDFGYGVNSPRAINLNKDSGFKPTASFSHPNVPAAEVAPLRHLFSEMAGRPGVIIRDTIFKYDQPRDNFWWSGYTDERSHTHAQVLALPVEAGTSWEEWDDLLHAYYQHADMNVNKTFSVADHQLQSEGVSAIFNSADTFHIYYAEQRGQHLGVVHAWAGKDQQLTTIPLMKRIMPSMLGQTTVEPEDEWAISDMRRLMIEKEFMRLNAQRGAERLDTFFVSNDHEGHVWWNNMDGRCPTRASVVRVATSEKAFDAMRQRLPKTSRMVDVKDEECHFLMLTWRDGQRMLHGFFFYFYPDGRLVAVRADGEEENSVCVPHYQHGWFDHRTDKVK